jgi:hypothetical protein
LTTESAVAAGSAVVESCYNSLPYEREHLTLKCFHTEVSGVPTKGTNFITRKGFPLQAGIQQRISQIQSLAQEPLSQGYYIRNRFRSPNRYKCARGHLHRQAGSKTRFSEDSNRPDNLEPFGANHSLPGDPSSTEHQLALLLDRACTGTPDSSELGSSDTASQEGSVSTDRSRTAEERGTRSRHRRSRNRWNWSSRGDIWSRSRSWNRDWPWVGLPACHQLGMQCTSPPCQVSIGPPAITNTGIRGGLNGDGPNVGRGCHRRHDPDRGQQRTSSHHPRTGVVQEQVHEREPGE